MASPPPGLSPQQTQQWASSFQDRLRQERKDPAAFGFGQPAARPAQPQSQPPTSRPAGNFSAYSPGQAQPQQSPWATATQYGQQPAWAQQLPYGGQNVGVQPFQFRATDFMGNQFSDPAAFTAQQGAMTQALNQQRAQQISQGNFGPLNPSLAYRQGQEMLQAGWQNQFAQQQGPVVAQGPAQQAGPQAGDPAAPGAGNAGDPEPWRNDEYFQRWLMNQPRLITPGFGRDIRAEYEYYLKLPRRDGRILRQDPRREMEELQKRQVADAPYWQGRSDAPSGSVWDHPDNWAVRKRILDSIAEYDKDPYADTGWAPRPDYRPAPRLPGPPSATDRRQPFEPRDPAGNQVRGLIGPGLIGPGAPMPPGGGPSPPRAWPEMGRIDRFPGSGRELPTTTQPPMLGPAAPDTRSPEWLRPLLDRQRQQPAARPISPGHAAAMSGGDSRLGSAAYADFARQQPIFVPNDPSRPHKGGRTVYPGQPGHAAALAKTNATWHQQKLGWMK